MIAAVQLIGSLRPTAAPTVLARRLAAVAVERDHRSKSTDHGKRTAAGVGVPPDSKGTNRMSTVVADILPAAWRSAPSKAASSRHWPKSLQTFSPAVTVSRPEKTTRFASAPCTPRQWYSRTVPSDWSEIPARNRAPHRKTRSAGSKHPCPPGPACRKRPLHPVARRGAVELHASPPLRSQRSPLTG